METIYLKKVANGYTAEINMYSSDRDDELFLYKTKEEMLTDFPNVVATAEKLHEEIKAEKAAEKAAKTPATPAV